MTLSRPFELGFNDFPAMLFEPVSITAKPTRLFSSFTKGHTRLTYYYMWMTKYATEILERVEMLNCNPCRGVDTEKKLEPEGSPITNPTLYRSLARALQYLTFTRPDMSYAVQQLCLYTHDPREPHLNAMKRLIAYSDADWASYPATRQSTSGYCVFLGDNLLTWSSKCQDTLSHSSAEAEYRGVTNAVAEIYWICNLFRELHTPLFTATLV
nr:ribonuclease H-like domain-containing protein [Tanacetum cinerariifolium]